MGITTFKSLKKGMNNENITPKEKANIVWRNITGSIHKKVSVTVWDVRIKKHTAKAIAMVKIVNSVTNTLS